MDFIKKLNPQWPLRLGLGLMYLYSGYGLVSQPKNWYGFLPDWLHRIITSFVPLDTYLRMQGALELTVGIILLALFLRGRLIQFAALFAVLEFTFILAFVGVNLVTFRDIGLFGAAVSLFILLYLKKYTALVLSD